MRLKLKISIVRCVMKSCVTLASALTPSYRELSLICIYLQPRSLKKAICDRFFEGSCLIQYRMRIISFPVSPISSCPGDFFQVKRFFKFPDISFPYLNLCFLGATGMRVSELLKIKAEHVKLGMMDLYSKGGKMRRIYFPAALCEEAEIWLKRRDIVSGYIFTGRNGQVITARGIRSQLKVLAKRYKIPSEQVYPHSFRHRFAKNFLEKFNDISLLADLMGHESIETTRIYLTRSSEEQQKLIDRVVKW